MDAKLYAALTDRLETSPLLDSARAEVRSALGTPPATSDDAGLFAPREVFLTRITVEGFRGIGPEAALDIPLGPGLTVVVGRNGSGKSSFAEALELVMTGTTKRWDGKIKVWSDTWQCLHHDGPTRIAAELQISGQPEPVVLDQTWDPGAPYTDATGREQAAATLAEYSWDEALSAFRPFLAYAELASMFDKLTSFYAALSPILGLEDLDTSVQSLSASRLEVEKLGKTAKDDAKILAGRLDRSDPRQEQLAELLSVRTVSLKEIRAHLAANPPGVGVPGDEAVALRRVANTPIPSDDDLRAAHTALADARQRQTELASTDSARALAIAELLTAALALRDPERLAEDCPVCGTTDVLTSDWVDRATQESAQLRAEASALADAEGVTRRADGTWRSLAAAFDPDAPLDAILAAAASKRAEADAARTQLAAEDATWAGVIESANAWLERASDAADAAPRLTALKDAEKWLKSVADEVRNERLAPIRDQAIANWEALRHASSVELRDIALKTVGKARQASFEVRADGEDASALGVMSQGELLALSVSVFLPRAGLDESPFRFAVIDDPVQSMDPAKVDGLARVLADAAQTRQIVVFTHDDRLPDAIRRLKLGATVLQVHRRSGSRVAVDLLRSPIRRHLDDAKTMAKSERVPQDVKQRVVPTLCRNAFEAACAELYRRRAAHDGVPVQEADERLRDARSLRDQAALALLDDPDAHAELSGELRKRGGADAPALVTTLNAGAHGEYTGSLLELRERTQNVVVSLMQSPS